MSDTYPFADDPQQAQASVPAPTPTPPPGVNTSGPGIMQQWNDALADPTVRGSLLSFGLNLMQPPSFGDTTASQVGRAIGAAGEAQTAREETGRANRKLDITQQEADSKDTLREARANAAEARANTTAGSLDARKSQLEIARERLGLSQILQNQRRHGAAVNSYNTFIKTLPFGTAAPSFQDWANKNGFADIANGPMGGGVDPSAAQPTRVDPAQARTEALRAIEQGKDPNSVRAKYRQLTGRDADF